MHCIALHCLAIPQKNAQVKTADFINENRPAAATTEAATSKHSLAKTTPAPVQ